MTLRKLGLTLTIAAAFALTPRVFGQDSTFTTPALAADEVELTISIKDHKFEPSELKAPAGKAIKLTVKNLDASAEEFESHSLKVEKVIAGKGTAVIRIRAQTKGSYTFFGEYHEKTAKGVLIVE